MSKCAPEQILEMRRAEARARAVVKVGDRITRTLCGGRTGTFTFTHWENGWLCGRTVCDCAARNIVRINKVPVDFTDAGNLDFEWDELVAISDRDLRIKSEREALIAWLNEPRETIEGPF